MMRARVLRVGSGLALALLLQPASALAQSQRGSAWAARMVMEPVILAHGGFSALCNPRAARLAAWGVERVERAVQPTASQLAALAALREATVKAADLNKGVCPVQLPRSSHERLVFLEKRLAALGEATRTVIPAFEAFQATLSDEQKARLNTGPRRWRWSRN
jgi:LTXXQ motif family protein